LRNLLLGIALPLRWHHFADEIPEELPPKPSFIDLQRNCDVGKVLNLARSIDGFFGTQRKLFRSPIKGIQFDAAQVMGEMEVRLCANV